jgi:type IV secretory pathway TrbL component
VIPLDVSEAIRLLEALQKLEASGKSTITAAKEVGRGTRKVAKQAKAKVKRTPSAYNRYMAKTLKQLKKKHPKTAHTTLFKRAAKSWKRSAERKRSMK